MGKVFELAPQPDDGNGGVAQAGQVARQVANPSAATRTTRGSGAATDPKHVLPAALRHPPDPGARRLRHTDASQAGPKPAADARLDAPDRQSPETRLRRSSNPLRIPAFGPAAKAAGRPDAPESPRKEAGGAIRAESSPGIPTTAQDRHRSVQPGPVKSQPDRPSDQTRG